MTIGADQVHYVGCGEQDLGGDCGRPMIPELSGKISYYRKLKKKSEKLQLHLQILCAQGNH